MKLSSHGLICQGVTIGDDVMYICNLHPRQVYLNGLPAFTTKTICEKMCLRTYSIRNASTILSGIEVGHNAIVGAGSVVTTSIPDDGLAYGNPCKLKP